MTHRVFVYGTLKSGFSNHYLLEGCEFVGGVGKAFARGLLYETVNQRGELDWKAHDEKGM
jgi:gamma-glutamylcyclotransferase (GGCT)/AIG2-like uncharacterized protein YtfP